MNHISSEMDHCVEAYLRCYALCTSTAMGHCLEMGGAHTEKKHFVLMMACAEICRTAAHFMLINSAHYQHVCRECAEICQECARSCEQIGGMADCASICWECAEQCGQMAA